MADNKKKKVDFREALRAQQPKTVDYVDVLMPGTSEPVRIARGNLSDEEWEQAKVQAAQQTRSPPSPQHGAMDVETLVGQGRAPPRARCVPP